MAEHTERTRPEVPESDYPDYTVMRPITNHQEEDCRIEPAVPLK